ncbi:MAG: hypothetical protein HYY53_02580 [candidate division NC10 bacterium]|nr:hypothetical protein [candidate division NC10 bacterium]
MSAGDLVRDRTSNLLAAASRLHGGVAEAEFTLPLANADLADVSWRRGEAYQVAVLVGPGPEFTGVTPETWMSDQVVLRIGPPSAESIYHAALVPRGAPPAHPPGHPPR